MMLGWVVGTVGVALGAVEVDGVRIGDVAAGAVAGAGGTLVVGSVAGTVSVPPLPSTGDTTGTVVEGDEAVLDLATPASSPTPATPPAAMSTVMLAMRDRPSSRPAGVGGRAVMPQFWLLDVRG
jgi:hypothetical protein